MYVCTYIRSSSRPCAIRSKGALLVSSIGDPLSFSKSNLMPVRTMYVCMYVPLCNRVYRHDLAWGPMTTRLSKIA